MANILSQRWLLSRRHVLRGSVSRWPCLCSIACGRCLRRQGGPAKRSVFITFQRVNTAAYEMTTGRAGLQVVETRSPP